jgi:hypothetical protein
MAGRYYGTMFMGYYYDESKTKIGYKIFVEDGITFHNVAYHSRAWLINQLVHSGYKKEEIIVERCVND